MSNIEARLEIANMTIAHLREMEDFYNDQLKGVASMLFEVISALDVERKEHPVGTFLFWGIWSLDDVLARIDELKAGHHE